MARKTKTSFIFIVPNYPYPKYDGIKFFRWYQHLSKFLQDIDRVSFLTKTIDFGNVISEQYKALKNTIKIRIPHVPEGIKIKINNTQEFACEMSKNLQICKDVGEKAILKFMAKINVSHEFCAEDKIAQTEISVDGIDDKLILHIQVNFLRGEQKLISKL